MRWVLTEQCREPSLQGRSETQAGLPRKAEVCRPYRKPTQVVEESILRRSSDPWLRN